MRHAAAGASRSLVISHLLPRILSLPCDLVGSAAGRTQHDVQDPGTFWHVAAGDRMLATGKVIREDPFSFTATGTPGWPTSGWPNVAWRSSTAWPAGTACCWPPRRCSPASTPGSALDCSAAACTCLLAVLLLAVAIMAGSPQFHVRPLITTIVLLGVTFAWLVDVENGSRRLRHLWWLVPLFILWTNTHGGVLGGLGTVGLCVGGWCVSAARQLGKSHILPATTARRLRRRKEAAIIR